MKALNDDLQMRSDWVIPLCTGAERIKLNGKKVHSTQKPEALLYRVILSSSNPGDVVLDPFFGTGTTGTIAKRLHRNWIGIEKDEDYVRVAQERINQTQTSAKNEALYTSASERKKRRVPFGRLLEVGLIQPGQVLFLGKSDEIQAVVRADASIQCGEVIGSIHKVAKEILAAPANGWEKWYFLDEDGQKQQINQLRVRYRALIKS
jgi:modification methylase